jgi:hypothetical protein
MKKTAPFELFGPNQFLMFDIMRLAELEAAMGKSIVQIMESGDAGIRFCITALPIGMKQHYHRATPAFFAEKIEEYLEKGGMIDDIAVPIVKAIVISGVFGTEMANRMEQTDEVKNG